MKLSCKDTAEILDAVTDVHLMIQMMTVMLENKAFLVQGRLDATFGVRPIPECESIVDLRYHLMITFPCKWVPMKYS